MSSKTVVEISSRQRKQVRSNTEGFEFEKLIERARKLEAQTTLTEVERRYALGLIVQSIHTKYQKKGVALAAMKLGRRATALYEVERLPVTWPDARKFKKMVAATNAKGLPLELSHFIALTYVDDPKEREKHRTRALQDNIGAKDFRRQLSHGESNETEKEPPVPPTATAKLCELMTLTDEFRQRLLQALPLIEGIGASALEPEVRQLWAAAHDKLEALEVDVRGFRAILKGHGAQPMAEPTAETAAEPLAESVAAE